MKIVSTEELISHKILPYNIYSEFGEKLFAAGEILTPGKLLQLRHINVLYRDEDTPNKEEPVVHIESISPAPIIPVKPPEKKIAAPSLEQQNMIVEKFDMLPSSISKNKLTVDDIDLYGYKGPINKKSKITPQTQLKIKAFYGQIMSLVNEKAPIETLSMFANVRDKIIQDILVDLSEVSFSSQLKLLGEYNKCHALNTAILSGSVAQKMEMPERFVKEIVLAGLLHDIGKTKIPESILERPMLTNQEQKLVQNHTRIGYKVAKFDMELSESIARVALEHHEFNDGSGYPAGKSGDQIDLKSQIVCVCNYFDNLTSNRTPHLVSNTKDAMKVMLTMGTQKFSAKALYTFIHMFSYNDTTNFEEMIM